MTRVDFSKRATLREQLLGAVLLLGLLIFFIRIIVVPSKNERLLLTQQMFQLTLEKDALQRFTDALKISLPQKESVRGTKRSPKFQILKGTEIPMASDIAPFLAQLTRHSFLKGISVKGMSNLSAKEDNGVQMTPFFINVQGSFRDTVSFLDRVQAFPALTTIDQISLKVVDPRGSTVDLEISGTFFRRGVVHGAS